MQKIVAENKLLRDQVTRLRDQLKQAKKKVQILEKNQILMKNTLHLRRHAPKKIAGIVHKKIAWNKLKPVIQRENYQKEERKEPVKNLNPWEK